MELGWGLVGRPAVKTDLPSPSETDLVCLPEEILVPHHIQRLTGIDQGLMQEAIAPEIVARRVFDLAVRTAAAQGLNQCPTLIHYARFETPFLQALHRQCLAPSPFPLEIFCTHKMARQFLPDLPRKGLRAVSGYLGQTLPELKRCQDHVSATAHIWQHFIPHLAREGVHTLEGLRRWNATAPAALRKPYHFPMPRDLRLSLPEAPGIYHFLSTDGTLLYIGKARSLKKRVNSYFQKKRPHSEYHLEMLSQAVNIQYTRTASALEAALMESEQIKHEDPPYNRALRSRYRQLHFISRTYDQHQNVPSPNCPLGPIPNIEIFSALSLLIGLLKFPTNCDEKTDSAALLALPPQFAPGSHCLVAGLECFGQKYASLLQQLEPLQALRRIGRVSWREHLERKSQSVDPSEIESSELEETAPEFEWTPGGVVKTIESLARRGGFLLRRAAWLTTLSNAVVAWETATPSRGYRVIRIRCGVITQTAAVSHKAPLEISNTEVLKKRFFRQSCFDLITYDRLRVLTTEIRRLVAEERWVEVYLRPTVVLRRNELLRLLAWI